MTPEGEIKKQVCDFLSWKPYLFFWIQESVGQWDAKRGIFRKKNSKYHKKGVPDVLILYRYKAYPPVFVGFELKQPKKKLSENQEQFKQDIEKFGSFYFVITSVQDAQKALNFVESECRRRLELTIENSKM